jgi:hypothetical protein
MLAITIEKNENKGSQMGHTKKKKKSEAVLGSQTQTGLGAA